MMLSVAQKEQVCDFIRSSLGGKLLVFACVQSSLQRKCRIFETFSYFETDIIIYKCLLIKEEHEKYFSKHS